MPSLHGTMDDRLGEQGSLVCLILPPTHASPEQSPGHLFARDGRLLNCITLESFHWDFFTTSVPLLLASFGSSGVFV